MAKPFAFRLDRVLDYRRQLEDQAKMAVARALAELTAKEREVRALEERLDAHLREGFAKAATAGDVWLWRRYREALEQDIAVGRAEAERLALKLQKCSQDLVNKSKDRKLLEKLKEHQARKHHEQESRKEEKESGEMAALRYEPPNF